MRKIRRRIFIASATATLIAAGSAYMASNVVNASSAGDGQAAVTTTMTNGTVVVATPDFNAP